MINALTVIGAFFSVGMGATFVCLLLANIFKSKETGIDEGHIVMSIVLGIMAGLSAAAFTVGSLWF